MHLCILQIVPPVFQVCKVVAYYSVVMLLYIRLNETKCLCGP